MMQSFKKILFLFVAVQGMPLNAAGEQKTLQKAWKTLTEEWTNDKPFVERLGTISNRLDAFIGDIRTIIKDDITSFNKSIHNSRYEPENQDPERQPGLLDTEQANTLEFKSLSSHISKMMPDQSALQAGTIQNPFILPEEVSKKYSSYNSALYAYFFCSEEIFKAECEKLTKDDQKSINHYTKAFEAIFNGLKNNDNIALTSTSPLFLKSALLKKTVNAFIEYLEDPDFDSEHPTNFKAPAPGQLAYLFDPMIDALNDALTFNLVSYVLPYAIAQAPQDQKNNLREFYTNNKVALLIDVFFKSFNKDQRMQLARFFKHCNIAKIIECSTAEEVKKYIKDTQTKEADEEVSLMTLIDHGLKTAFNIGFFHIFNSPTVGDANFNEYKTKINKLSTQFLDYELLTDNGIDISGFQAKMAQFKADAAAKPPFTDRASFKEQSIYNFYENYLLNEFLQEKILTIYACFSRTETGDTLKDLIQTIKKQGLPLVLSASNNQLSNLIDTALRYHNSKSEADLNQLQAQVMPLLLTSMNYKVNNPLSSDEQNKMIEVEQLVLQKISPLLEEKLPEDVRPYLPQIMLCIPDGFLLTFLTKNEEDFLHYMIDHVKQVASPFVKTITQTLIEYSWQKEKITLLYDKECEELNSSLSIENDIPTYIDLFFDLKAGKCTNPELIAYYDAISWNEKTDRAIIFKEASRQALSQDEQIHKNYFQTLPLPMYNQNPYVLYQNNLQAFIARAGITSEEAYRSFVEKVEKNRFALILHKNAAARTSEELDLLTAGLYKRIPDVGREFTLKEAADLQKVLQKEVADQTKDEKTLIIRLEDAVKKIIYPLTTEQSNAIQALDQLKKLEVEASTAEHRYVLFINNRELFLKEALELPLTTLEKAKINTIKDNGDTADLHENATFIQNYNFSHPKITKEEVLIRERFRIIAKGIYKHNVDLLQYRLEQTEHTTFFKDPLFVASSFVFSIFNDPTTIFGQQFSLPSLPKLNSNILGSAADFVKAIKKSSDAQLHDLLITKISSPELVAVRDAYLQKQKTADAEVEDINLKGLLDAYLDFRDFRNTPKQEQLAIQQAIPFFSVEEFISMPLGYSSFLSPSKTVGVRNSDSLYMQIPYIQTFLTLLDSTPANLLDAFVAGGKIAQIKQPFIDGLNSISDIYFKETPKTSSFKEYIDIKNNPDPESPVKKEAQLKASKEMTEEMKRKIKEKMLNDDLEGIKAEQKAKEQNNRVLFSYPISKDISLGITPYDIRSLAYEAGEAILATKIDTLVESTKNQTLREAVLTDSTLLSLLKNIDSTTRNQLVEYQGRGQERDCPVSIRDDRPKQGIPSPLSLLPALPSLTSSSKKKKKEVQQSLILKQPKYNPSAANKLRAHLEGSASQNGLLTPLINNPKSLSLWKNIGLKTAFTYLVNRLRGAAIGQNAFWRTYENTNGTLKPKKDSIVITPSNIDPLLVAGAVFRPEMVKEAGSLVNETTEAVKYVPKIVTNLEKTSGINLSGSSVSNLPATLSNALKMFIPNEVQIWRSDEFIFSEYSSATVLSIFGTFFEYLLYDKISSRKLSLYFQQNLDELESLMKAYQKAKKHKDTFAMKKVEKKFEKFISKSKVSFSDRSLILKLLPRLFLLFNLVARFGRHLLSHTVVTRNFVDKNNYEVALFSLLNYLGVEKEEIDTKYKVIMGGAIGAIGYSLWKSLKVIENLYYN